MSNGHVKVVVMGGGTGIFPVTSALKRLQSVDISTIIAVTDSGGSTGRIRDEFGFQPVGDLRQSLAALAEDEGQDWIRKILLYRFERGNGLKGHNLGNLILTALQDMTGDTSKALEIAEKVFRLDGSVIPVTQETVDLKIHYVDGTSAVGEHVLDEVGDNPKKISRVELVPPTRLNPLARQALLDADLIIIGPGDFYANMMGVLLCEDTKEVFSQIRGKIMYIVNLMTRVSQTKDMTAVDHLQGIEQAIGRSVDLVLVNDQPVPDSTLQTYAKSQEFPVEDDLGADARVIRHPIINDAMYEQSSNDSVPRSLLRHDTDKLETVLRGILFK